MSEHVRFPYVSVWQFEDDPVSQAVAALATATDAREENGKDLSSMLVGCVAALVHIVLDIFVIGLESSPEHPLELLVNTRASQGQCHSNLACHKVREQGRARREHVIYAMRLALGSERRDRHFTIGNRTMI